MRPGGWSGTLTETQVLAENVSSDNDFGVSVAVYSDTIVVGAHYDDDVADNAGKTYLFTPNQIPVANAGGDQNVDTGELVQLDGSGSSDPDGNLPLTYGWQQTGGVAVSLSNTAAISPTFTAPGTGGLLTFTLTVTDSLGTVATPDTVQVLVEAAAASDEHHTFLPVILKSGP